MKSETVSAHSRRRQSGTGRIATRTVIDRLSSVLFAQAQARAATPARLIVGVLALVCGLAATLLRTGGSGALRTVTFEDGTNFLSDAWNRPALWAVFQPLNGYYAVGPRVAAWFAALFPIRLAAAVLTLEAALCAALLALAVYVASGAHFRSPLLRLLVCAPILVMPVAQGPRSSVDNNVATLQFLALYALFWMLIWVPASRTGRAVAVLVTIGTAFSTLLSVLLLPLALIRLVARRERHSVILGGAIAAGATLNLIALVRGITTRPATSSPRYDPIWALVQYGRALPRMIFGNVWGYPHGLSHLGRLQLQAALEAAPVSAAAPAWLYIAALAIIAVVVSVALRGLTRPAWLLAAVATACSLLLFAGCLMSYGSPQPRYLVAPALLLITAMAALLRPRQSQDLPVRQAFSGAVRTWTQAPAAALTVLVAIICLLNFHDLDLRAVAPSWGPGVATAQRYCNHHPAAPVYQVFITPPEWFAFVPCSRVRT
ncbi:MAG: hypothetical protein ACRDOK_08720 [Streptosporangiaceae bacterium]